MGSWCGGTYLTICSEIVSYLVGRAANGHTVTLLEDGLGCPLYHHDVFAFPFRLFGTWVAGGGQGWTPPLRWDHQTRAGALWCLGGRGEAFSHDELPPPDRVEGDL